MKNNKTVIFATILLLCFFSIKCQVKPNPQTDLIDIATAFPNLAGEVLGNIYSGYAQVSTTRLMHYWYAQVQPPLLSANVPLILWLNGGPGCSSMDGAVYEHGPFYFQQETFNTTPIVNPYSWNKQANVLYIESPAGVGFSVLRDTYPQDDYTVAQDNLNAVIQFLTAYNLWSNDFYVMGESYAGVYVPYLSYAIVNYNQNPTAGQKIQFQGYSVGNPCTSPKQDECYFAQYPFVRPFGVSQLSFLYQQGLVSATDYINFNLYCFLPETLDENACNNIGNQIAINVGLNYGANAPFLNYYDIYRYCALAITNTSQANTERKVNKKDLGYQELIRNRKNKPWKQFCASEEECESLDIAVAGTTVDPYSPCIDSTAGEVYFNIKSNWPYIGINPQYYSPTFQWSFCVDDYQADLQFSRSPNGSYWIHPLLVSMGTLKVMVYSGNTDLCVPTVGTRSWVDSVRQEVGLGLVESMRNWYYVPDPLPTSPTQQMPQTIAGSYEEYDNHFRFVTVNGVGHMVPMWNRKAAYIMLQSYLNWQPLPDYGQSS